MDKGKKVLHVLSLLLRKTAISLKHCLKAVNDAEQQTVRGKTKDILRPYIIFAGNSQHQSRNHNLEKDY